MARLDFQRMCRGGLTVAALATAVLLAACGPGQGSSTTTVVLTGPADKVQALIGEHKLLGPPTQARIEKLDDGQERAELDLPKGLPMGEVMGLGKAAMKAGVSYEFSSGTKWGSDPAPQDHPAQTPPTKAGGRVV